MVVAVTLLMAAASSKAVIVETGAAGRFISITNNGAASRQLHVGELEAFVVGGSVNSSSLEPAYDVARTTAGASYESQVGSTAHGGNTAPLDAILNTNSATFTLNATVGAQMVYDLGTTRDLSTVKLWQRADGCCQDRLSNVTLAILADNGGGLPGATVFSQSFPGQVATNSFAAFNVATRQILPGGAGVIGTEVQGDSAVRFIRVRNNVDAANYLGIGEIEVFAAGVVPDAGSGLSTNEITGLSYESQRGSTLHGANTAPFNNVLDSSGNVFTINTATGNEYVVDLNASYDLSNVRLFNRTDCCQDRLKNFTVSLLKDNGAGLPGDEVFATSLGGQVPNTPSFTNFSIPTIPDAYTIRATDTLIIDANPETGMADLFAVGNTGMGALTVEPGASLVLNLIGAGSGTFDVLDFGSVTGSFNVTVIGNGKQFADTSNLLTTGQILVNQIPEPASAAMMLLSLASLAAVRRRTAKRTA